MNKTLLLFLLVFVDPAHAETWVTWHSYASGITGRHFLDQIDVSSVFKTSKRAYGNGRMAQRRGNTYAHHSFWEFEAKCSKNSDDPREFIHMKQDGLISRTLYRMYAYSSWLPNAGWWDQREYNQGIREEYDAGLVRSLGYTQPERDSAYEKLFKILCD